ncbi:MAG: hypothetical protein ABW022_16495 [Actinoplanes sp.]
MAETLVGLLVLAAGAGWILVHRRRRGRGFRDGRRRALAVVELSRHRHLT